jgi:hypothetical protein
VGCVIIVSERGKEIPKKERKIKMTKAERKQYVIDHTLILDREELKNEIVKAIEEVEEGFDFVGNIRPYIMKKKGLIQFNCHLEVVHAVRELVYEGRIAKIEIDKFNDLYKKIEK